MLIPVILYLLYKYLTKTIWLVSMFALIFTVNQQGNFLNPKLPVKKKMQYKQINAELFITKLTYVTNRELIKERSFRHSKLILFIM